MTKRGFKARICILLLLFFSTSSLSSCFSDCPAESSLAPECSSHVTKPEKIDRASETPEYPEYNVNTETSTKGLTLRRVTDNKSSDETPPIRHHYSRRQAWNSDESLLDLNQKIVYYDTLEDVLGYIPLSSERNWSNQSKDVMYGIRYNPDRNELASFNITTEQFETIYRFEGYDKCTLGDFEGNLSFNDKFTVVVCTNNNTGGKEVFSINTEKKILLGKMAAKHNFNWASFSYSGRYILIENNKYPDPAPEIVRYSPTFSNPVLLTTKPQHGDLTIDESGNDIYAMIQSRIVTYIRLEDRLKVNLDIGGSVNALSHGHISCRNFKRPGWCYISTGKHGHIGAVMLGTAGPLLENLQDIDSKPRSGPHAYEQWGFSRTSAAEYDSQAKATVSPSGKKILFTTDWFGQQNINDFVLELIEQPN